MMRESIDQSRTPIQMIHLTPKQSLSINIKHNCLKWIILRNMVKNQCRRHERVGFDSWVGTIPWRRKWQRTLVFLPGESHGQESLVGYVHVVLPSPVSWVLEIRHTSGETVPEKRSPGTASPRLGNAVHRK